jgi:hypothetical protein
LTQEEEAFAPSLKKPMNKRRFLSICTTIIVIFLASCSSGSQPDNNPPTAAGFRKSPYLIFNGNNTQMTVLWQTTVGGTSEISWGLDTSFNGGTQSVSEIGPDHIFRHLLTGLTPGQKYHYRVVLSDTTATGLFVAAPAENDPTALFLYGDSRSNTAEHARVAAEMVSYYSVNPALHGIALHTGDLVTDGEDPQYWDDDLFSPSYPDLSRFLSEVPLQATMGNHEGDGVLFSTFFPYPFAGGRYWSFDYGVIHTIVVDQYTPEGGISSEELAWLAADLAATTKPWKIILLHEPGWSAGPHPNNVGVQLDIQPLAKQFGAIVVGGHNHYYARAMVDGVIHITTGGGGAGLYTPVLPSPYVAFAERTYHFCSIEATAGILQFKAVRTDGSYIETFTLTR